MMNRIINFCKYPLLLLMLLCVLPTAHICWNVLAKLLKQPNLYQPIAVGLLLYCAFAYAVSRVQSARQTLSVVMTLEHELTHMLLAICTLNSVHALHAQANQGGMVQLGHRSNWLVTAAPYFVPLPLLLFWPVLAFSAKPVAFTLLVVFGLLLGFHIHSSWRETHRQQTDLQELGWGFTALFLPLIHLWVFAWAAGVVQGNQSQLLKLWQALWSTPIQMVQSFI